MNILVKYIKGCKKCCEKRQTAYFETPRGAMQKLIHSSKGSTKLRLKKNNPNRDCSFDIDFEFLVNLYNEQHGLCAYSKLPMQFGSYRDKDWTMSLERRNTFKGYTKNNVLLICVEFNGLKSISK